MRRFIVDWAILLVGAIAWSTSAFAADGVWNTTASGVIWSTTSNWTGSVADAFNTHTSLYLSGANSAFNLGDCNALSSGTVGVTANYNSGVFFRNSSGSLNINNGRLTAAALASVLALGTPANAADPGPRRLENEHLRIEFGGEGLGVTRIDHRMGGGDAAFVSAKPSDALVWRLVLRGPGEKDAEVAIDNRAACRRSAAVEPNGIVLRWEGIDLPGEPGALDVKVDVRLPAGSPASLWRIGATNRSAKLGPWEVRFPVFAGFAENGGIDVAIPRGNWGILNKGMTASAGGTYPSHDWPMQMLLAGRGDRGLAFFFQDPEAWPKRFAVNPGGEIAFTIYPKDMGKPGAGIEVPFPATIEAYRGSWWKGAKRYRAWALGAPWAKRGPIAARRDFPEALRRVALWWLGDGPAAEVVPRMKEAARRLDVPQAIHWYNWHKIPFDVNYPEYFPTKSGFAAGVKELVAAGQTVMPYINGRLWDTGGSNFPTARPAACKRPGGTEVYIESYGSGANLAPMCPATPLWRAKVGEIVRRLGEECGVNAVYIDQIGSAAPVLCHDPTHGHPLGGGGHWVSGYRKMLEPIRDFALARGMVLTTENNAEPYMDTIEAFLIWLVRSPKEIPLTAAVYSGYTVYFSSPVREGKDPDAFAMVQGRDLLWGCQLGWMGFDLLEEGNREQATYLFECARYRKALAKFLLEGELLGDVDLAEPAPPMDAVWGGVGGTRPVRLPSVVTALWRAPDGHLGILAANLCRETRNVTLVFDGVGLGLPEGSKLHVERVRPTGREDLGDSAPRFRRPVKLGPREILALELTTR